VSCVTQLTPVAADARGNALRTSILRGALPITGFRPPPATMSKPDTDDDPPAGATMLERLQSQLAGRFRPDPALFRVVEVTRNSRGRLVQQGQIWHSDLNHVRRFARAVAANSVAHGVVVADAAGAVVEQIPVGEFDGAPAGWGAWRDLPLPPAPPRRKPRAALPKPTAPKPTATPSDVATAVPSTPAPAVPELAEVAAEVGAAPADADDNALPVVQDEAAAAQTLSPMVADEGDLAIVLP
jgi:hypothetical protein